MINSITAAYSTMQQAQLMQQVQTSVMASALDATQAQGDAVLNLINSSSAAGSSQVFTDPMLGQNVNVFA